MNRRKQMYWRLIAACFLIVSLISPVSQASLAQAPAAPASVTAVGDLQSELGCAGDWDPACAATHMAYDAVDDIWQFSGSLPAGNYNYKAALDDAWTVSYGRYAQFNGSNIPLNLAAATTVKFYYDDKSHWVADDQNYTIATAAGSFQSELGCPGDWQPDCLRSWLQDPEENGIYTFVTSALPAGNYQAKAAHNESWAVNYGLGGVQNGPDIPFTVPTNNAVTIFEYDSVTHIMTITSGPTSVTIAGSLQSELGCANDWDPACANTHMTYDAADDVWQFTASIITGTYGYKAAINDSWAVNYGQNAQPGGPDIPLPLAGQTSVKFYYDEKTHWVTDNQTEVIATAAGSFQSELGCPGDWQPDCLRSWLQDPDGDGTYEFSTKLIPAGNYEAKATINESWNENYGIGGVPGGPNIPFVVPSDGATVTFRYNHTTHILTISAGHGADNNVEYAGLAHDSQDSLYRVPFGSINPNTPLTLRFRTYHNDVGKVRVRFWDTYLGSEFFKDMQPAALDVPCFDLTQPAERCDFWQLVYTPTVPATLYYRFLVYDGTATAYYADDNFRDGGWGTPTPNMVDNSYAVTVFDPAFQPIPWMKNAVIYQIFPDRFRNGDPRNDPSGLEPRYRYPGVVDDQIITMTWDTDLPEGYCRNYTNPGTPCTEGPRGRDYFGGDLAGVRQKLDYLQSLGVNVIYFNPIFDAGSNHLYDTQDYNKIDPFFGTNTEFLGLTTEAHNRGMKVILDGVFNHVSSDSPYMDRYGHFADVGACESLSSPYRNWFTFREVGAGNGWCVGPNGANSMTYDSWFGFDSLPVLNKYDQQVKDLVYATQNAVARYWLQMGADGWRLDVMPDPSFPPGFWQEFRGAVQSAKPDAVILGELWKKGDVLPFIYGDTADSTMNYRYRNAILGFFGVVDNKGFPDDGQSNQPPSLFARKLLSVREDYPDAAYYSLMNLMSSHDTMRILWALTPGANNREDKEFNAANLAQGKRMLDLAMVVQMTLPGAPTIYYGDEVGVTGDDDPDDRRTFPWSDQATVQMYFPLASKQGSYAEASSQPPASQPANGYFGAGGDHAIMDAYRALSAIRHANPVFRDGTLSFLLTDDANRTMAYLMRTATDGAIVAINRNTITQTLNVALNGAMPSALVATDAIGPAGTITATNGVLSFSLPPLSAAVFLPAAGQDLTAPGAPTGLTAAAGNGQVALNWNAAPAANEYGVYRSVVTGGGYQFVGLTASAPYTDTTVTNGTRYYYVVRAVDAAGNYGGWSNEAAATPAFPIVWANLQWPPTIDHTIGVTPTTNIYGQVYVPGVTDVGGSPSIIWAQVGFGPTGTTPSGWTTWTNMVFNVTAGNNFEYMASLRPEQVGVFDYQTRYSTNKGETWTYGTYNGNPGVLTVNANPDTTPPAAPANLRVTDWSAGNITLAWDPVSDAAEYWLYRNTGGAYGAPLVQLAGATTTYNDTDVVNGQTYTYTVKAVDAALNLSPASNEISKKAEPKMVQVTFRVRVPAESPPGEAAHITGDTLPLQWNPGLIPMTDMGGGIFEITLPFLDGTNLQYKYTRGVSWERVEWWGSLVSVANRSVTISYGTNGTQLVDNTATDWGTGPDSTKAVQFWRDPLVSATTPADGSSVPPPATIQVNFSRAIQAMQGGTFDNSVVVTYLGSPVAGTVSSPNNTTLVWTPSFPLIPTYTYVVTVYNVRSDLGGDSVPLQAPYTFSFTVTP